MGKTANCIKMLQLLSSKRLIKISELARLLETNPRNIIEYKKELEEAGYFIESVPGKYGGYRLDDSVSIPALKMTNDEKKVLVDSYNFCMNKSDFLSKDSFSCSMGKVFSNLFIETMPDEFITVNKVKFNMGYNEIEKRYNIIQNAIKNKIAINITYRFLKGPIQTIKVHPYSLFLYDNEWRFFAWYVDKADVWYFKLSRIDDISITNEKFRVWKSFKAEDYLKGNVFSMNGESFQLTLIAEGVRAKLFKEKIYGKNQICEDLDDGTTKVTLEMQKNPSTYNFLVGCGDLITVKEPEWLVEKIKTLALDIANKY